MAKLNPLVMAPPVIFGAIAVAFFIGLGREDAGAPPTGREGGPAPEIIVPALGDNDPYLHELLSQPGVKLVNFWASWCTPCRVEHPNLEMLADEGVTIYGINYKDDPENALRFLDELGNPYAALGADTTGRAAIEWGVAGVPETFVVDGDGTIILRFPGPVTERVLESRIRPAIENALATASN